MQPKIIQETKDYILIDKPAGLIVHSDGRTKESTVCDWVLEKYPEIADVGESMKLANGEIISRPGIVHRIDRDTSGIMIIAKNKDSFEYFKKQFQEHKIEKKYHAFVYGNIKEDNFIIDKPIGRNKNNFKQWFSGTNTRGNLRDAITEINVLKRSIDKSVTFIEAIPKTGRTHQIRVHLKSINNPIISDKLYAPNRKSIFGFDRMALHAKSIKFISPAGEMIFAESDYPDDFKKAVEVFK